MCWANLAVPTTKHFLFFPQYSAGRTNSPQVYLGDGTCAALWLMPICIPHVLYWLKCLSGGAANMWQRSLRAVRWTQTPDPALAKSSRCCKVLVLLLILLLFANLESVRSSVIAHGSWCRDALTDTVELAKSLVIGSGEACMG